MKASLRPAWLAALLGTLLWAGPGAAAMYKWVDAQGNVHYTQTPPADRDARTIAPPPRVPKPPEPASDKAPDTRDSQPTESPPEDKEWADIKRKNCETARGNLEIYKNARRIRTPAGEVIDLTDEMRKEKIKESEEQIKRFCQ